MPGHDLISAVEVRALDPVLLGDYLAFFDGPAFVDNPHWASCFCYFHHNPDPETWDARTASQNRSAVADLIRAGRFHGYLAYRDGLPVGWCHAARRREIPALGRIKELEVRDDDLVGSIVCFIVALDHRRSGVASALLDAACRGFSALGLSIAEAYPRVTAVGAAANYHGPMDLYTGSGFAVFREFEGWCAVRKGL
jgi:GNAT superfamily N-acetyltransferase